MGKFCDVRSVASSEPVKDDPGVTDDTQDLSVPVPFAQFTVPIFTVALFPTVIELGTGFAVVFEIVKLDTDGAKTNPDLVFVIELKPGADSVIAMNHLYNAAPDGYTIAIPSYMSTFVTNDIWQKDIKKFQYNSFTNIFGMQREMHRTTQSTLGRMPLSSICNQSPCGSLHPASTAPSHKLRATAGVLV